MNLHAAHRSRFNLYRLLVAVCLGLATMSAFAVSAVAAEKEPATAAPPVLSASEIDYPPFCVVDAKGRADGFSVELLRAALAAMGRNVAFRTGLWSEVRAWLERGEVQALPMVGRTPERESIFDFTVPYMSLHGAIVVRQNTTDIRDLADLQGRQVAVMKGDNTEEFLRRENRGIEIHTTATFEEALRELSEGRYDAVVIQRLVAVRLIQEAGLMNLRVVSKPIEGFRQDFCFAVKEGDRETLALLNEGLALIMADGTYRHLHAKWFAALELPSHRRIVVGGDYNYPPYEYLDESGRPAGFVVDLTRAIAREVGLDIEIRLGPWAEMVQGLEKGEIDVIEGMFYSPERDLKFDFTQPHLVSHYVSVVRNGEGPPPSRVDQLKGKRIVVQKGDIIVDFLAKHGLGGQVSVAETQEEVLRQLAEGKYDCALAVRMSALYLIEKHGWVNLSLGRRPIFTREYCYAVLNNQRALLASFSEGLQILKETGEYRRINEKWLGVYREKPLSLISALRYSAMVLIPLLLILLAVFLWLWSLRKQVARRTAALQDEAMRRRILIDQSRDGIVVIDQGGKVYEANQRYCEMLGYSAEEISQLHVWDWDTRWTPEQLLGMICTVDEVGDFFETRHRRKDGTYFDVEISTNGAEIGGEKLVFCVCRDITERKWAEHRIEHLNRVLRAIRDVNQLIIRERDAEALIREGCRLLVGNRGYAFALIVLTDDNDRPVSYAEAGFGEGIEQLAALLDQGKLPPCCEQTRQAEKAVVITDRNGLCGACPITGACAEADSLCVRLMHNGAALGYLAVAVEKGLAAHPEEQSLFSEMADDFAYALHVLEMSRVREKSESERRSLEAQLIQAQKMESVGRLAGGVAHDYNNMLGVIIGYTELALMRTDPANPVRAHLEEILKAARRSADITRQLLAFARKQTVVPRVLDLNETVEGMLKMLRRLIGEDIDLAWLPETNLWPIKIDATQIDQILANLCVNARDAIAGVGKITIETENIRFDEDYCADHAGFVPGEFVLLAVSDDGKGMPPEIVERVFEPFFTTKSAGLGTGLGLATVYGIVKQNDGFINVYSEPGKGTTIKIYLPRHAGPSVEVHAESAAEIELSRGETILLVEDEPQMMKMGKLMLEKIGYQVLTASTPSEATRFASEHAGRIHLLITDVVMPEMNGRDLANRLQSLYPDLKILFMSGYTANTIAHRGVLDEGVNFIQKPFSMRDLAAKVRAALE